LDTGRPLKVVQVVEELANELHAQGKLDPSEYYIDATFSATGTGTANPGWPREWFIPFKYQF